MGSKPARKSIYVTDADRERVIEHLQDAFTRGAITREDFDSRLNVVQQVPATGADLAKAVAKLPLPEVAVREAERRKKKDQLPFAVLTICLAVVVLSLLLLAMGVGQ